eukprot:11200974-Lingulodinium_polyedra.AAC.1
MRAPVCWRAHGARERATYNVLSSAQAAPKQHPGSVQASPKRRPISTQAAPKQILFRAVWISVWGCIGSRSGRV